MSATRSHAKNISRRIQRQFNSASAVPAATRMRNTASAAKRIRADVTSAQRLSLPLLFTFVPGPLLLGPVVPAEEEPAASRPRLQRLEAVA